MLGFSVYLNQELTANDYNYLITMQKAGFSTVFTSLHIPENDPNIVLGHLEKLADWCKELDLELIADVSKKGLKKLGINIANFNQIKNLKLTGLRIDDGVDYKTVAALSKEMPIALNASTLTEKDIIDLQQNNANFSHLQAWHNYYPRPETGLSGAWLKEKNDWLHQFGLQTMAFIAGDAKKRGPIFAGLPTLEKHRNENPLAAKIELSKLGCDSVFIGDGDFSISSIGDFEQYLKDGSITLHLDRKLSQLTDHVWHNRPDVARDVVRLEEGRYRQLFSVLPQKKQPRPKGTITCDNEKYLRYQGELQITKLNLPEDERVNVLGHLLDHDLPLLDFVDANTKIIFK